MAQEKPAAAAASAAAPQGRPPATAVANKTIERQSAPKAGNGVAAPAGQSGPATPSEATVTAVDASLRSLEIAALQAELKAKQKRVELLMHLFVIDERHFVQFPADPIEDPAAKARIRAEQEELRAESAACARLKARLEALTGGSVPR